MSLSSNQNRTVLVAVLNAALRSLGMLETSLHCQNESPERCAVGLARHVSNTWGRVSVGLIGLHPAIAEALSACFGAAKVRITDLSMKNIGTEKADVPIWNGRTHTEELIRVSQAVLITGTTLVNGTFDAIWNWIQEYERDYLIYGVTGVGACKLMDWNTFCPYSRSS